MRATAKRSAKEMLHAVNNSNAKAFREVALTRRSCPRFQPNTPICPSVLKDILKTTLTTPSGFNLQPTQIILVTNPEIKSELSKYAMLGRGNQFKVNDCSALAVFLSDLLIHRRFNRIFELEKQSGVRDANYLAGLPIVTSFLTGEGHLATLIKQVATSLMSTVQPAPTIDEVKVWSYKNTAMAAQTYTLAACSHGLSTCMMEGYDSRRVSDILRLPPNDRYGIPVMVATGFEYQDVQDKSGPIKRTPRLGLEEVVFSDTFGSLIDNKVLCSEDVDHLV